MARLVLDDDKVVDTFADPDLGTVAIDRVRPRADCGAGRRTGAGTCTASARPLPDAAPEIDLATQSSPSQILFSSLGS
jgi:hypothetical protein